ncbi:MAG: hypothetical protein H6811_04795 [Phycisphaeraceae bacterium]|nr:hypothetical protein [Phycisphaeraceae bacterium]
MNRLREILRRADRLQKSLIFKLIASVAVLVVAIGVLSFEGLRLVKEHNDASSDATMPASRDAESTPDDDHAQDELSQTRAAIEDMLSGRSSIGALATGIGVATALTLTVIWLGLFLSYLVLLGVGAPVAIAIGGAMHDPGLQRLLLGILMLAAAFSAAMQGLRAAMAGSGPVLAIARNVLAEAVRMRLSMVFIILLIFALAAVPGLIDSKDALRYRVQALLQYGTGGSFWIIALLVVLFSVATVAFDQRNKTIWQTMTKPVAPWQYVLGKWLGVTMLAGALLAVCASGVFMFTEYLRGQRALGEVAPYVTAGDGITEDRLILESQVLTARVGRDPDVSFAIDDEGFRQSVKRYIEDQRRARPDFAGSPTASTPEEIERAEREYQEVLQSLYKSEIAKTREIPPGMYREYTFSGLGAARGSRRPITVYYKIEISANDPTHFYIVGFTWPNADGVTPIETPLAVTRTLTVPTEAIDENGELHLAVLNGGLKGASERSETFKFASPNGLQVSFTVGGYRMNFARVALVLWIKLGFLAMIGIVMATFLSFPVAVLCAFVVFFAAEGTTFMMSSLDSFRFQNRKGETILPLWVAYKFNIGVTRIFKVYADLRPTTRLVDGKLMGWASVAGGLAVLGTATSVLYGLGVLILRRRELATYSGH